MSGSKAAFKFVFYYFKCQDIYSRQYTKNTWYNFVFSVFIRTHWKTNN